MTIDIICVGGRNGADYAKLLHATGVEFASGHHVLRWCYITTPKFRDVPEGFIKILDLEPTCNESGLIHSEGLMAGLKLAQSDYVFLCDTDILFLKQDFDIKLIEKMTDGVAAVGAEWGGEFEKECYQDFPCTSFALFKTDIAKRLNVNLCQGTRRNIHLHTRQIRNKRLAEIFNRPVGRNLILETGWRLPYYYKRAGYTGYCLQKVCPFDKQSRLPWPKEKPKPGPKKDKPYRTRK